MIYIQLGIVIFLGIFLENISFTTVSGNKKRALYIIICLGMAWLIAALRNVEWVTSLELDAGGYAYKFDQERSQSWTYLIDIFKKRYIYRIRDDDIGYSLLNKIIGLFTDNYNVFSLIADSLFFIPFGTLLFKYTTRIRHVMVANIFYIALIQVYLISGGRQMFALGLDIAALLYLMENKKRNAIILWLLGITIHFSSLIFGIPLLMAFIGFKGNTLKRFHVFSLMMFVVVYMFPNQIIQFMGNLTGIERYVNYGAEEVQGGTNTFIFLLGFMSCFCYVAFNKYSLWEDKDLKCLYNMVPLFTIFGPLIYSNGSMIRICLYFFLFLAVLIPLGLDKIFSKESRFCAYSIATIALVVLIIKGGVMDYHFMWQSFG